VSSWGVVRRGGRVSTCWVGSVGVGTRGGDGFSEGVDEVLTVHGVGVEVVRVRVGCSGSRVSRSSSLTESRLREEEKKGNGGREEGRKKVSFEVSLS